VVNQSFELWFFGGGGVLDKFLMGRNESKVYKVCKVYKVGLLGGKLGSESIILLCIIISILDYSIMHNTIIGS